MKGDIPYKFKALNAEERELIENTEMLAYICEGTETEIKEWFKIINIGGIKLNEQETLNAIYSGPFVSAARKEFSNKQDSRVQNGDIIYQGLLVDKNFCKRHLIG